MHCAHAQKVSKLAVRNRKSKHATFGKPNLRQPIVQFPNQMVQALRRCRKVEPEKLVEGMSLLKRPASVACLYEVRMQGRTQATDEAKRFRIRKDNGRHGFNRKRITLPPVVRYADKITRKQEPSDLTAMCRVDSYSRTPALHE